MSNQAPETTQATTNVEDGNTDPIQAKADETKQESVAKAEVKKEDSKEVKESTKDSKEGTVVTEPQVPEKYDLKLPKDSLLDAESVERLAASAKERKLSQEQAQAELARESEAVKTYVEGTKAKMQEQSEVWVDQIRKDSELGGDKFNQNVELAKRVVDKYGSPELKEQLNNTRLGNHPELVRLFVRVGKEISEDKLVLATKTPVEKRSAADILYGDTSKQGE